MSENTIFYLFVFGLIFACLLLFYAARKQSTDDKSFGSYYIIFLIFFFVTVQLVGRCWYFPVIGDALFGSLKNAAKYISEKTAVDYPGNPAGMTVLASNGQPLGSPADYVEWASTTEVQPKAGRVLPVGWRVSYTVNQIDSWIIEKKTAVPATGDLWIVFDPDPSVLATAKHGPMLHFSPLRP